MPNNSSSYDQAHNRLLQFMQDLGYKASMQGSCLGIANMATQAILCDDLESFNRKIEIILSMTKSRWETFKEENGITKTDILAFCDGVVLYQSPDSYAELFNGSELNIARANRVKLSRSYVLPAALDEDDIYFKENGIAGIFAKDALRQFFEDQTKLVKLLEITQPLVFIVFLSGMHAVTIAYLPKNSEWILIDPNQFPIKTIVIAENEQAKKKQFDEIANFIALADRAENRRICLSVDLFSLQKDEKKLSVFLSMLDGNVYAIPGSQYADLTAEEKRLLLYMAVYNGNKEIVTFLLDHGMDVNISRADNGVTPLCVAVDRGYKEIAALLLAHGADVNIAIRDDGATLLHLAVERGDKELVVLLLAHGAEVNKARTDNGVTPLYTAAGRGHKELVVLLLAHGAEVNKARTDNGVTPLYTAAYHGHKELVVLLLAHGAEVNKARADDGVTPLYAAVDQGYKEIAALLLAHGADVNIAIRDDGATLLYLAVKRGHKEIVALLLAYDAEVNKAISNNGMTPLHIAVLWRHEEIAMLLLAHGAEVHKARTDNGATPLYTAVERECKKLAALLLVHGADVNMARTDNGVTPLYVAVARGYEEIAALLLAHGAEVNKARTDNGMTPLLVAVEDSDNACVELLLSQNADIHAQFITSSDELKELASELAPEQIARVQKFIAEQTRHDKTAIKVTPLELAILRGDNDIVRQLAAKYNQTIEASAMKEAVKMFIETCNHNEKPSLKMFQPGFLQKLNSYQSDQEKWRYLMNYMMQRPGSKLARMLSHTLKVMPHESTKLSKKTKKNR